MPNSLINRLKKLLTATMLFVVFSVPMAQAFTVSGNLMYNLPEIPVKPLALTNVHVENESGQTVSSFDPANGGVNVCYTTNYDGEVQVKVSGQGYQQVLENYSLKNAGENCTYWYGKLNSSTNLPNGAYTFTINAKSNASGTTQTASASTTVNVLHLVALNNLSVSNVHLENLNGVTVPSFNPKENPVRVCYDLNGSMAAVISYEISNGSTTYAPTTSSTSVQPGNNLCTFTWYGQQNGTYVSAGTYNVTVTAKNLSTASASTSVVVYYNNPPTPGDTTAPVLGNPSSIGTTSDHTPSWSFSSNEAGTINYYGSCSSTDTNASAGTNTVTLNYLPDGTYSNCYVTVRDTAGNTSSPLYIPTFTVQTSSSGGDTVAPVLTLISGVTPNPTTDTTPNITFYANEGGTIYWDGCSSATNVAMIGNNTVTLDTLAYGTYSGCRLRVKDTAGNYSEWLNIPAFTVQQQQSGDTTAPVLGNPSSIGTTSNHTPSWSFTSSEAGTISYSGSCSSQTTSATSGTNTIALNYLPDGTYSNCYVTVRDASNNVSAPLYIPTFTVQTGSSSDTTPPSLSNPSSIGNTSDSTPNWSFYSSEAGTISYYGSCSSATTSATSGTNTVTLNNLADGTYSNCYVTVKDAANNVSSPLYIPTFTIYTGSNSTGIPNITSYGVSRSPFNPEEEGTYVQYAIDREATVTVEIYSGSTLVRTLVNGVTRSSGSYSDYWNGYDRYSDIVSDGSYTYRITASNNNGSNYVTGYVYTDRDSDDDNYSGDLIDNLEIDKDYFNPKDYESARITWDVKKDNTYITVSVLDDDGKLVRTLVDDVKYSLGTNQYVYWNGKDRYSDYVSDAVYKVRVTATRSGENDTLYAYTEVDTDGDIIGFNDDDNNDNYNAYYNTDNSLIDNVKLVNATFDPTHSESTKMTFDVLKNSTGITVDILEDATIKYSGSGNTWGPTANGNYYLSGGTVIRTLKDDVNYSSSTGNYVYWNGYDSDSDRVDDGIYVIRLRAEKSGYSTEYAYGYLEVDTDGHIIGFPNDNDSNSNETCGGYWDVSSDSPYCKAIELMNLKGIFNGYPDGSFRPYEPINRAEATKVILLALGKQIWSADGTNLGFSDVSTNAWYMPYLRTARALAVISGYPDRTFKPAKTLNRVELLKIFLEAANANVGYCTSAPYADTPSNSSTAWYMPYVCYAAQQGLMYGDGNNNFNPATPMTRGDVANLFYNYFYRDTNVAYYDYPYYN